MIDAPPPRYLLGFDPDSRATAYALAELTEADTYVVRKVEGGGRPREPVAFQTITGCLAILRPLVDEVGADQVLVAVETQTHGSTWARSCEELWAQRYHLDAACELLGVDCHHVAPTSWMRMWVPEAFKRGAGKGAGKKLYRAKGRELFGKLASNEDRAAALGIVAWFADALECELETGVSS